MNEIKINRPNIEQLKRIGKLVAKEITETTGADVEVTFTKNVLVYTEDLGQEKSIIDLMKLAGRELLEISRYDAEEGLPAGATFSFTY